VDDPGELGIALHPDYDYVALEAGGEVYVVAGGSRSGSRPRRASPPRRPSRRSARAPRADAVPPPVRRPRLHPRPRRLRDARRGTGCVHTAPGHGREDYETGLKYGLPILAPLNDEGRFTADVPFFAGERVFDANPKVNEKLAEVGALMARTEITHAYPHAGAARAP